jgi:hypothetical protein
MSANLIGWMANRRGRGALTSMAERLTNQRDSDKVASFVADLDQLVTLTRRSASTLELLRAVRDRVGLDDALSRLDQSRADAQAAHLDDLDALVALARLHPEARSFEAWLAQQLGRPAEAAGVTLATIHKVKGREWPHIVMHDARAGLMPHRLSADVEEERRVFHVGLTRCSSSVTVVAGRADDACPFVAELAEPGSPPIRRLLSARSDGRPSAPGESGSGVASASGRAGSAGAGSGPRGSGSAESSVGAGSGPRGSGSGAAAAATKGRGKSAGRRPSAPAVPVVLDAAGESIRDALRAWRSKRAAADAVPAYVVLTNTTLDAIASSRPGTLEALARLPGIGPAKRERYGDDILEVVGRAT